MNTRPNPYVGPRSFQAGEPFYGRDRELRSLSSLLVAERIVLLHSPSGAGKSSLIQAGLLPRLVEDEFNILPPIRVNQDIPAEVTHLAGLNRYTLSALLSLEEGLPEAKRLPLEKLAALTLDAYLTQRPRAENAFLSDVLVFDQFEEVLTIAPADHESKQVFFEQLGEALRNKQRWALFAVREDYLGALAPYTRPIPGRFAATFRLDLLGVEGAVQAIQRPAKAKGVEFVAATAQKLTDDLRRIQVQLPDGLLEEQLGQHVEPVQLQVVCLRLWQGLDEADNTIDETHLAGVGDVNQSLADYYAASVKNVAEKGGANERSIREWFDRKLITPDGIRGQVLMGAENSEGLPNRVVGLLEDAHIIRGEKRAGKTWYELSHDRMLKPVRENNALWFEQNLSLFQRQAVLWSQQGRSDGLLLRGKEFQQAEKETPTLRLTEDEKDFLAACQKLREREQRDRRQRQFILAGLAASLVLLVVAVFFGVSANAATERAVAANDEAKSQAATAQAASTEAVNQRNEAETQKATAVAAQATAMTNEEIAQSNLTHTGSLLIAAKVSGLLSLPDGSPELAALLSLQSINNLYTHEADSTLLTSLTRPWPVRRIMSEDRFTDLAFSPDSQIVATVGDDPLVRLWNVADGKLIATLSGHTKPNTRVVFSSDGKYLLTASTDGTARLWDLTTATTKFVFSENKATVNDVAISPDSRLAATASSDNTVRIWDLMDVKKPPLVLHQDAPAHAVAFSPKGRTVLVGLGNGKISLWNAMSGARTLTLIKHLGPVYSVAFSPDGRYALSGSNDKLAILWDLAAGQEVYTLFGHSDSVYRVLFSPDGKYVLTSSWDKTARLWNLSTRQLVRMYTGHFDQTRGTAFSPDGKWIATASLDQSVILWDSWLGHQPDTFINHTDWVYGVAYSPDGKYGLSGSRDKTIRYWDVQTATEIKILTGHTYTITSVEFSPDGKRAVSASVDDSARVWDLSTGKELMRLLGHTDTLMHATYSHGGQYIATGSYDKTAFLWDAATGVQVRSFTPHDSPVMHVSFSPDDQLLATASSDTFIRLWDVETGERLKTFTGHTGWVWSVEFSPDGKYLLSAGTDSTVRLWDVETGEEVRQFVGPTDWTYNVAFSPDGRYVLAGGREKLAWVWETATGTLVRIITGHTGGVIGVAFNPDGQHVMTGGFDSTVRVWPVNYQDTIADACNRLTRDLTDQERAVYKLSQGPSCAP